MKKLFVAAAAISAAIHCAPALAADMPVKAPVADLGSWTGYYFGGHTGEAFGLKDWANESGVLTAGGFVPFKGSSTIGGTFSGVQAGYNWQNGSMVLGVELSGSWADVSGFTRCGIAEIICNTKVDWFGSATARIGYAADRVLYYAKGGATLIHDKGNMNSPFFVNVFNGSDTRWGWTAGAGVEYAFTRTWSAFAEYDYMDFGTNSMRFTDQFGFVSNVDIRQNMQLVKFGMNFKLGADPASGSLPVRYNKAPAMSDWTMEAGTRYWYSDGKMKKVLFDPFVTSQMNSRLTYGPQTGNSLEGFMRFDHLSGLFVKGFLGFGDLSGGNLLDEDFPPALLLYSATDSAMKDSRFRYGALDVGDAIFKGPGWKAGPFVGYRYYYQVSNGFGCTQVGLNPGICGAVPAPTSALGLTETQTWRGVAVGLNGEAMLTDRLKLAVDAAYLPYVSMSGFDNHWFRADINPQIETGHGWGTQLEAILSYAVTDRWSVGLGGRYWRFQTTEAHTQFPGVGPNSPEKFTASRYGAFVQTSYKFGDSDLVSPPVAGVYKAPRSMATNWAGVYVGGHAGGGWGASDWKSATTGTLALPNAVFPGSSDINGLLAGGQIGFRSYAGTWIWGVQLDESWSDFTGTAKCATIFGLGPKSPDCNSKLDSVGSLTASLGRSYGKFLFYGKVGAAWASEKDSVSSFAPFALPYAFTGSQTRVGWTLGSGLEYALTPNWSVFAEYDYLGLGNKGLTLNDPALGASNVHIEQHLNVVKIGANYRFDWFDAIRN